MNEDLSGHTKTFIVFLVMIAIVTAVVIECQDNDVKAASETSGSCGEDLTWVIDSGGTLSVSGSGHMYNYSYDSVRWGGNTVKAVIINDGVESIGSNAFRDCTDLISVIMPNSVISIESGAFYMCSNLTSVFMSDSISSIGEGAFGWCSGLISISIPYGVTSIEDNTFYVCSMLKSVTIPNSVTKIGNWAFGNCSGLTSVGIPDSVTKIGEGAFGECSALTSISLPNKIKVIEEQTFVGCEKLASISIPNGVTSIGKQSFSSSGLESIILPDSVKSIGETAFLGCSNLMSVTMSKSVELIPNEAFAYCNHLTSFIIPNSVTTIGASAFKSCSSLGSVTIPDSVSTIEYAAFAYCGLTSLALPDSIRTLGVSAFDGCNKLLDISFGEKSPSIRSSFSNHSFYTEDGLTVLDKSVSSNFEGYTFKGTTTDKMIRISSKLISHTVFYDSNGGSGIAPDSESILEGSEFIVKQYTGSREGFSFGGWRYGGSVYTPGQSLTMGTSNIIMEAVWNPIPAPDKQDPDSPDTGIQDSTSNNLALICGCIVVIIALVAVGLFIKSNR